eukprot:4292271-Pleurochrysis_carterae.AAC.2
MLSTACRAKRLSGETKCAALDARRGCEQRFIARDVEGLWHHHSYTSKTHETSHHELVALTPNRRRPHLPQSRHSQRMTTRARQVATAAADADVNAGALEARVRDARHSSVRGPASAAPRAALPSGRRRVAGGDGEAARKFTAIAIRTREQCTGGEEHGKTGPKGSKGQRGKLECEMTMRRRQQASAVDSQAAATKRGHALRRKCTPKL